VTRTDQILKYADLSNKGIEVAPYFNPTLRKCDGHDILVLDVFDTEKLRQNAATDAFIPQSRLVEIEDVDLVGDASHIGDLVRNANLEGQIGFIISSHNFEHLPNPILFLQGAYTALKPGGMLSMAVPDCRACFDFFRVPTRLVDWLAAFHEGRKQPSPEIIFDGAAMGAWYIAQGKTHPGCNIAHDDPAGFVPHQALDAAYDDYKRDKAQPGDYRDAHCSVFFPESLELLLTDLRKLGLIGFDVVEISQTHGLEFYVHLRKPDGAATRPQPEFAFYKRREELLRRVTENLGSAPYSKGSKAARSIFVQLFGTAYRTRKLRKRIAAWISQKNSTPK
jgi:predicted SAM-dependent methyltransferase